MRHKEPEKKIVKEPEIKEGKKQKGRELKKKIRGKVRQQEGR